MTAVEEIKTALACRASMYRLMYSLFVAAPSEDLLACLTGEDAAGVFLIYTGSRPPFIDELNADSMAREYTPLFIGPGKLPAPPWESVYRTGNRVLFQKCTLEVRSVYLRNGLIPAGYPNEADDHIATELNFMGMLAEKTAKSFDEDHPVASLLDEQAGFLENHLFWVKEFAKDIDPVKYPSYSSLSLFLSVLLEADRELIKEIAQKLQ